MKGVVLAMALALSSSVACADDRAEKIRAIMEAQGLVTTFEQQLQAGRAQAAVNAKQMLDQVLAGLLPNSEYKDKFRALVEDFIQQVRPSWSAKQVVAIWADLYGSEFSDAELDQLLVHYRSPLAQKEVVASRVAMVKFSSYFQAQYKPVLEQATATYIQRLKAMVADCNCTR